MLIADGDQAASLSSRRDLDDAGRIAQ